MKLLSGFTKRINNSNKKGIISKLFIPLRLLKWYCFICCIVISSCAKMPSQAVDLSHALKDEGQRMHEINIALVEYVFNEKK